MSTILHVGRAPKPFECMAEFLDGERPVPELVRLSIDEAAGDLIITGDGIHGRWPLEDIREVPDQADTAGLVLRLKGNLVQRVLIDDRALVPRLPNRTRSAPTVRRGRLMGWAVAALMSVALIIFVLVPTMANQLAVFIPREGERALGETTLDQVRAALSEDSNGGTPFCTEGTGEAALRKMTARLQAHIDADVELTVFVLDHEQVNAFALPGGLVVLLRGLLESATEPEQVAAVLAHEIGHVVSRDPTRNALRSAGSIGVLGLIFGDFAGGALVLFLANQLINAQYSQEAEAAADAFAHDLLRQAGLRPDALADMFEVMARRGETPEGIITHFMSHPELGDRIESARTATPDGISFTPVLSEPEWLALQEICR